MKGTDFKRGADHRKQRKKEGVIIMKEELTNKGHSILMPFVVGGIVGAGLSLLLAPKSGKEVREDIKRFANDSRERVSLAIDKGKELYDDSKERVSFAIDKGKELYDGGKAVVGKTIEAGKTAYVQEKEKWQHT